MAAHPKSLGVAINSGKRSTAVKSSAPVKGTIKAHSPSHLPIAASTAKAHLLRLLDQVERDRTPIPITKRGRVVAQLMPAPVDNISSPFDLVFRSMKGSVRILGDIVSPDHEAWGPNWR